MNFIRNSERDMIKKIIQRVWRTFISNGAGNIAVLGTLAFFSFAAHAIAAEGFTALAPITGLTDSGATSVVDSDSLANFFNNLYKYLIGLAATLAVIEIIWGGLEYSTQDSVSKQSNGRERITQAIFGLILVLSPVLVFSIINPSILNLSLNLPALDTKSGPPPSSAIKVDGTGTVCSGYSEYRSANIPAQKYCTDQFGGGWVNVDASCCAAQSGSSCCGLNSSYKAPVETAPVQIPGGEVVYDDVSKIPPGSWCYVVKTQGAVLSSTQYDCAANQNDCIDLHSTDGNTTTRTVIGSCKKY